LELNPILILIIKILYIEDVGDSDLSAGNFLHQDKDFEPGLADLQFPKSNFWNLVYL
jgi:hypothetical protein